MNKNSKPGFLPILAPECGPEAAAIAHGELLASNKVIAMKNMARIIIVCSHRFSSGTGLKLAKSENHRFDWPTPPLLL